MVIFTKAVSKSSSSPYTHVPRDILVRSGLSIGAKAIYVYLCTFEQTGACAPTYMQVSTSVDLSPKTVRRYLGELIGHQLVFHRRVGNRPITYHLSDLSLS